MSVIRSLGESESLSILLREGAYKTATANARNIAERAVFKYLEQ